MTEFSQRILDWFTRHERQLPWRGPRAPYAVWVSEIMLQQTRVETVIPYFERWMDRFPSVADLAAASEQEVLALWEGLGYYSRARNILKAAKIIVNEHHGELPNDPAALHKLPGVGRNTCAAIASIAFGRNVAILDGNLRRVFSRVFNVEEPADTRVGEKRLWSLAEQHLPQGRAGDYNQALMDLGATVCLPHQPACSRCPVSRLCRAYALGIQEQRPVRRPRPDVPHYTVTAAVIRRDGKVLLAKRPSKGLLGGMWEFPGGKVEVGETYEQALCREISEELDASVSVGASCGVYRHAYTHFRITLHAFVCRLTAGEPRPLEAAELAWAVPAELAAYPMGKVDRQIARRLESGGIPPA